MENPMERLIKGVHILPLHDFIAELPDEERRARIYDRMQQDTREMLRTVQRDEWRPMALVADMNEAIYTSRDEPAHGYEDMVAAGKAIADYAAGTYVRLLIKLMTPKILASKWPAIWRKSHSFGEMTCVLESDRLLRMTLADVRDYTHVAPFVVGFLTFSLNAMGLADADVAHIERDASPNSSRYEFQITW
jgi:uncharacterized protein (TIGR02265 family)